MSSWVMGQQAINSSITCILSMEQLQPQPLLMLDLVELYILFQFILLLGLKSMECKICIKVLVPTLVAVVVPIILKHTGEEY